MSLRLIGDFSVQGADVSIFEAEKVRPCGDCKACCTVIGVVELGKNNFQKCQHVCSSGCKIYEKKPTSCSDYFCWYTTGLVKQRPDRIGLIVDYQMVPPPDAIRVWEVREGASKTRKGKRLISMLRKKYNCEIMVVDRRTTILLRQGKKLATQNSVAEPVVEDSVRQEFLEAIQRVTSRMEERK